MDDDRSKPIPIGVLHFFGAPVIATAAQSALECVKMMKSVDEAVRHPRYQNDAPRSPKPRFKKGRR